MCVCAGACMRMCVRAYVYVGVRERLLARGCRCAFGCADIVCVFVRFVPLRVQVCGYARMRVRAREVTSRKEMTAMAAATLGGSVT